MNSRRIILPTHSGQIILEVRSIVRIEAKLRNTLFYIDQINEPILILYGINKMQCLLNERVNFFQCHRGHIINFDYVVKIKKECIETTCGVVPVSRKKIPLLNNHEYLEEFKLIKQGLSFSDCGVIFL